MKTLERLNNVERAQLLFDLFPAVIPSCIECMKTIAENVISDADAIRENWEQQIITADFWLQLAKDTKQRIDKYGVALTKQRRLFTDQLFDGYNALFAVHCLQQFIKTEECDSTPFEKAVEMLYG